MSFLNADSQEESGGARLPNLNVCNPRESDVKPRPGTATVAQPLSTAILSWAFKRMFWGERTNTFLRLLTQPSVSSRRQSQPSAVLIL